ncbi:MAG: DUF1992 domain-containing protein [Planctomycetes bacterium]|nr:DUF1992 domain-containing protein [Planctomycetota bacterium]
MTERKPFGVPYETWIDRLVREAQERGDFDDLPVGKPIPNLDRPWTLDDWAREKIRDEGVSILPPGLQLRRDVEKELDEIMLLGAEQGVRNAVERLNEHIRSVNRSVVEGPASLVRPLVPDEVVALWRARRK